MYELEVSDNATDFIRGTTKLYSTVELLSPNLPDTPAFLESHAKDWTLGSMMYNEFKGDIGEPFRFLSLPIHTSPPGAARIGASSVQHLYRLRGST